MKEWIEKMEDKYQKDKKLIKMMLQLCEDHDLTQDESKEIIEDVLIRQNNKK